MFRTLDARIERWPLCAPFRIARGTRTAIDVVVVTVSENGFIGRGEGTPTARYGETPEAVIAQIAAIGDFVRTGGDRAALRTLMPAGSARNAVDSALWDLEAKIAAATPFIPGTTISARTVSIDAPDAMAAAASGLHAAKIVKVKVDNNDPASALRAVRDRLPDATLIVDANESWTMATLTHMQPIVADLKVALLEQPLPAGEDAVLAGFESAVPLCADESCHVVGDIDAVRDRYSFINIKLDKTGGLTEAMALLETARRADMGVMVGCMLGTSLGIAPALRVAEKADYADLDGPWWLAKDRDGGVVLADDGHVHPPRPGFWGDVA